MCLVKSELLAFLEALSNLIPYDGVKPDCCCTFIGLDAAYTEKKKEIGRLSHYFQFIFKMPKLESAEDYPF